jgi:hypothetical protein
MEDAKLRSTKFVISVNKRQAWNINGAEIRSLDEQTKNRPCILRNVQGKAG